MTVEPILIQSLLQRLSSTVELCMADCIVDCIRFAALQAIEWQRIGNQIDAAMISAGAHFVNVRFSGWLPPLTPPRASG
jgi:hypothetical protein